jgi:malate dehydrogenase
MVPLPRFTSVAGIPVKRFINNERLNAIIERTRNGGAEITSLLKTSAYYAPASAIREMAEAILKDKKKIMPCSAYLEGEYGIQNMFVGVPVKLGSNGVEQIIEVELTESEKEELKKSVDSVKSLVAAMKGRS